MRKGIKYHGKYIMSKKPLSLFNPNTLSVFIPTSIELRHNPLQEVDTYITGLPEGIPRCEAEFVNSFIQNGMALIQGSFGKTYINVDRSNVMKMIDLQKRYNMLLISTKYWIYYTNCGRIGLLT